MPIEITSVIVGAVITTLLGGIAYYIRNRQVNRIIVTREAETP